MQTCFVGFEKVLTNWLAGDLNQYSAPEVKSECNLFYEVSFPSTSTFERMLSLAAVNFFPHAEVKRFSRIYVQYIEHFAAENQLTPIKSFYDGNTVVDHCVLNKISSWRFSKKHYVHFYTIAPPDITIKNKIIKISKQELLSKILEFDKNSNDIQINAIKDLIKYIFNRENNNLKALINLYKTIPDHKGIKIKNRDYFVMKSAISATNWKEPDSVFKFYLLLKKLLECKEFYETALEADIPKYVDEKHDAEHENVLKTIR